MVCSVEMSRILCCDRIRFDRMRYIFHQTPGDVKVFEVVRCGVTSRALQKLRALLYRVLTPRPIRSGSERGCGVPPVLRRLTRSKRKRVLPQLEEGRRIEPCTPPTDVLIFTVVRQEKSTSDPRLLGGVNMRSRPCIGRAGAYPTIRLCGSCSRRNSCFCRLDLLRILCAIAIAHMVSSPLQLSEFRTDLRPREFGCSVRKGNDRGRKHGGCGNCLKKDFHDGILNLIEPHDCGD